MNKVILIGRLTRDPELRYTPSQQAVTTFTLAVDRNYSKSKKQEAISANKPTADFLRINIWGKMAENASKYLTKGSQCAIEGSIQTSSYQSKEGKTVYVTDILASNVTYLDTKKSNNRSNNISNNQNHYSQNNANNTNDNFDDFFDDDDIIDDGRIPF